MSEKTILMANEDANEKYAFDKGKTYFLRRILIWQKWAVVDPEAWWATVMLEWVLSFNKKKSLLSHNICKERLALTYR